MPPGSRPPDRGKSIHLVTELAARGLVAEVQLLPLDERIRRNAAALGFRVAPAD